MTANMFFSCFVSFDDDRAPFLVNYHSPLIVLAVVLIVSCSLLSFVHSVFRHLSAQSPGTSTSRPLVNLSANPSTHPIRSPRGTATHSKPPRKGRRPFLPLTMVFGGLAVALYAGDLPFAHVRSVFHKVDLQSMFFALIFVVVILVLGKSSTSRHVFCPAPNTLDHFSARAPPYWCTPAYLTNPTENSFRTYLTEQSFRQHLSRLDDPSHDEHSDSEDSGVHFNITRRLSSPKSVPSPPFHFANRAAVSLRTPKHVFYSFGIMTIAAVLPSGASNRSSNKGLLTHQQSGGFLVSESWFIGAFGKWWRGGPIQSWWIDSMANSKDTERCNSGVLDMKALDNVNLECFEGASPLHFRSLHHRDCTF